MIKCRKLKGQRAGLKGGEQIKLSFEEFPHLALSRTYCFDNTVADSACSATSYFTGVKANKDTIGVTADVRRGNCDDQKGHEHDVNGLFTWAQKQGMATGIVTTDRLVNTIEKAKMRSSFAVSQEQVHQELTHTLQKETGKTTVKHLQNVMILQNNS